MKKLIVGVVAILVLVGVGVGWYYFQGPCGVNKVKAAGDEIQGLMAEYEDALDIASSTSRISLSGPVAELQDIKRQTEAVEVPACLVPAHRFTIASMEKSIEAFISFMGQASDSEVNSSIMASAGFMEQAVAELETVSACAPFCKTDPQRVLP